jgi:hypothetical protein
MIARSAAGADGGQHLAMAVRTSMPPKLAERAADAGDEEGHVRWRWLLRDGGAGEREHDGRPRRLHENRT